MTINSGGTMFDVITRQFDSMYLDLRRIAMDIPNTLFHFSDSQGLMGILTSHKVWASNADFLNDSSEPSYALEIIKRAFEEVTSKLHSGSTIERALAGFWKSAMKEYETLGPHIYIFCLSEHDDLLSQWRSYGAYGAGYAMAFDGPELNDLLKASEGQYLLRVIYEEKQQKEEAKRIFGQIVSIVEKAEKEHGRVHLNSEFAPRIDSRIRTAALAEIIRLRAKFKTSAFSEEGEWRLAQFVHPHVSKPPIKFQAGAKLVKPYLEVIFDRNILPICEVTIGPTLSPDLSKRSVDLLLKKCGYSNTSVKISEVPFRG
jgi:hypothetical protein